MSAGKQKSKAVSPMASDRDGEVGEFDDAFIAHLAQTLTSQPKKPVNIRLDPFVVQFFKSFGSGYQTRIAAVLRAYALRYEPDAETPLPSKKECI